MNAAQRAQGVMPFTNALSLGTIGLKAHDLPWYAFERADVVICIGYDVVEYHPDMWNPKGDKKIIHINGLPAEVDERYNLAVGALGDIPTLLQAIAERAEPRHEELGHVALGQSGPMPHLMGLQDLGQLERMRWGPRRRTRWLLRSGRSPVLVGTRGRLSHVRLSPRRLERCRGFPPAAPCPRAVWPGSGRHGFLLRP